MNLAVGVLILVGLVFLASYARARKLLLVLLGTSAAFDTLQVSAVHLTSVVAGLLLLESVKRHDLQRRVIDAVALIGAAVLLALSVPYGSLVNSPRLAVQLLLLSGTCASVLLTVQQHEIGLILRGLLLGISAGGFYALLQDLRLVSPNYFIDSSGIDRVHSFYREPDFLAVFAAVGLVLAVRLPLSRHLRLASIGLAVGSLLFTLARGAIIGLVISALAAFVALKLWGDRSRSGSRKHRVILSLVTVLLLAGGSTGLWGAAVSRAAGIFDSGRRDIALQARLGQLDSLLGLAASAPWHGYGLSAAGRVMGLGEVQYGLSRNNVATNWVLDYWVGGKLLALPLIAFFLFVAVVRVGSVAGQVLVLLLVNSLFSNVLYLPVTWLALGLALISGQRSRSQAAPNVAGL